MGKQKYYGKTKNTPEDKKTRPYTEEDLNLKIEYAEKRISYLESRIRRLTPFLKNTQDKIDGYVSAKQSLEDELKQYTGFLNEIKYAVRALLLQEQDEAKYQSKRILDELKELQTKIDEESRTLDMVEKAIAENKAEIQEFQGDANRWRTKKNSRFPSSETCHNIHESQPGE